MTSYATLIKGGESGEAGVVPGKPDDSELLSQILPSGNDPPAMPKGKAPLQARPGGSDSAVDRRRGQGRYARRGRDRDRSRPSACLCGAAGDHVARLLARRHAAGHFWLSRSAAAQGRRQRLVAAGWSACPNASSRLASRLTANGWPSPAVRRAALAKCRSGTSRAVQSQAIGASHLRHDLRRELVGRRQKSPSAVPTTPAAPSTPPPASRSSFKAPTTTGCSTPCSRPTLAPGLRQP